MSKNKIYFKFIIIFTFIRVKGRIIDVFQGDGWDRFLSKNESSGCIVAAHNDELKRMTVE